MAHYSFNIFLTVKSENVKIKVNPNTLVNIIWFFFIKLKFIL